jgi:TPP-dependent pyruvate/acetoin dehydrogenase alpha subunit
MKALNMAAVEKLPIIVSIANNQYAYSTPNTRQYACENLVDRAAGYGVEGVSVDATDLASCLEAFRRLLSLVRVAGGGPQMIVGTLLRLAGHGEHDDASYIPDKTRQGPSARDCLAVAENSPSTMAG